MKKYGKYILKYKINGEEKELIVEVKIKQVDGPLKPRQNIWEGYAIVNDEPYEYDELKYCVDAKYMTEEIGLLERTKLKKKYKKKMRIIKQIIE